MTEDGHDLVVRILREAWERYRQQPPSPPPEPPTIHGAGVYSRSAV
jgi:hypothetical protein